MFKYLFLSLFFLSNSMVIAASDNLVSCEINENAYIGHHAIILERLFGKADDKQTYQIKDVEDEFRIELLNIYPPTNPENLEVRIWERTWNEGSCRTTVWFHKIGKYEEAILARGWHKDEESR